jgi:GT2 family glycosyltransferase/glycosyltransferase involved in cell wall biosynthesis
MMGTRHEVPLPAKAKGNGRRYDAIDQFDTGAALRRLADERRRAETLRRDYERIQASRFHALRMLWFSFKAVLGLNTAEDRFAAWSSGMAVSDRPPSVLPEIAAGLDETQLESAWRARVERAQGSSSPPIASVIIPVYNNAEVTVRCLQSIADTWFDEISAQVIVVDDGSTDATSAALAHVPGLEYLRLPGNCGFIGACNRGAMLAQGKYICFLNNDTVVRPGWLDHLVRIAESDPAIGAAGAKLLYPDGTLQEAGNIIWRDGTGWNYGRNRDPADPNYNYVRDVDYCSGAALLVRRSLFEKLGGFSEMYAPAYYEDADLCFGIRELGFRVVYQPRAEVVHIEGATSGTDLSAGTKRFQEINRPKFRDKWSAALESHFANSPSAVEAAARRGWRKFTVLMVDSYVPMYDRDAGSARMMQLIRILTGAGIHVIFLPDNYAALEPYTQELQNLGVEVLYHSDSSRSMREAVESILPLVDFAWICRPELFEKYAQLVRKRPPIPCVYDTIDLHFVRKQREANLLHAADDTWRQFERTELGAARSADATVVVTQSEKNLLQERGIEKVFVIPTIHDVESTALRDFSASSGLLFIGGYNHPPNVDAVMWLCKEIMPRVWRQDPTLIVTLLGSDPPDAVRALQSERIRVPGYLRDVSSHFVGARVFVAPLRYGAGMNGKVGQALSYRLPPVLTENAADGFSLSDEQNCLLASDTEAFASAILRLYNDAALWQKISNAAPQALAPLQSNAVKPALLDVFDSLRPRQSKPLTPAGASL